jgi:hypothetical protein
LLEYTVSATGQSHRSWGFAANVKYGHGIYLFNNWHWHQIDVGGVDYLNARSAFITTALDRTAHEVAG